MSGFKKNTATVLHFCLVDASDGSAVTAGTTTCYYCLDGGTQATGNTATHEGNGQWSVVIAAAHINGDSCGYLMVNSSSVPVHMQLHTTTKFASELNDFDPTSDTVATVTTLTNLPAITAGWLTSAGIAASALDGKGDWNIGKTGYSISGTITTLDGLNDLSASEVNAEVVDVLETDTHAEPGQGAPAATASLKDKIGYIYKFLRNKKTATSTTISVYDDAGTTVDQKSTISDDGTTYTEGEYSSGP